MIPFINGFKRLPKLTNLLETQELKDNVAEGFKAFMNMSKGFVDADFKYSQPAIEKITELQQQRAKLRLERAAGDPDLE